MTNTTRHRRDCVGQCVSIAQNWQGQAPRAHGGFRRLRRHLRVLRPLDMRRLRTQTRSRGVRHL
ncbi:hypothetical protein ACQ4WX_02765 [Streptomyces lasalocidi]